MDCAYTVEYFMTSCSGTKFLFLVYYIYFMLSCVGGSKQRHALCHSKIPAASAISTFYECYIRNLFKPVFRALKPEILHHSP